MKTLLEESWISGLLVPRPNRILRFRFETSEKLLINRGWIGCAPRLILVKFGGRIDRAIKL